MAWTTNTDGTRSCDRHATTFGKRSSCAECRADPGERPGDTIDEPLSKPPKGCLSSVAVERELVKDARAIAALIVAMTPATATLTAARRRSADRDDEDDGGGDYHLVNAIAKLYDTRAKCLRAAADAARNREYEEIVRRREKRMREMQRGAVH